MCVCQSICPCVCLYVSVCLSLSVYLSMCLCVPVFVCVAACWGVAAGRGGECVCVCVPAPVCVVCVCLCTQTVCVPVCVYLYQCACVPLCVRVWFVYLCVFVCLYVVCVCVWFVYLCVCGLVRVVCLPVCVVCVCLCTCVCVCSPVHSLPQPAGSPLPAHVGALCSLLAARQAWPCPHRHCDSTGLWTPTPRCSRGPQHRQQQGHRTLAVSFLGVLGGVITVQWGGRSSASKVQGILRMPWFGRGWIWGYQGATVWWRSDMGCCRGLEVKLSAYRVPG